MSNPRISACVVCFNEENNIAECLKSISFVDEIIIIDSMSTDRTPEIARQFTDKFFQHEWLGNIRQKNLALSKATGDWVLGLDADERVPEELRKKILEIINSPASAEGYRFPRKNYFLGKCMHYGGWYPDHVLRFFRREKGHYGGVDPHDRAIVSGKVETLSEPLLHYTYTSFRQYVLKQLQWSLASAGEIFKKNESMKYVIPYIIFKPPVKFFETYIFKIGFMDGIHGFIAAFGASFFSFTRYVCLWEMQNKHRQG